jgi:subtilase family serine protease
LTLQVVLHLQDAAGAESLATAVSDPASPLYGQYLSADAFRTRFAPTVAQVAKVTKWLTQSGLSVVSVPDNHRWVTVTGTVAQAEKAFATQLTMYQVGSKTERAPASAVKVPPSVAAVVAGVEGLASTVRQNKPLAIGPDPAPPAPSFALTKPAPVAAGTTAPPPDAFVNGTPCSAFWNEKTATTLPTAFGTAQPYAPCGYVPSQLQGAYGTTSLAAHGVDGKGVTVAVVDAYAAPTIRNDVNTYATRHGQPRFAPGQFKQIVPDSFRYGYNDQVNGDLCGEQGWYGEETLDVEAVHAMAPGANVLYVGAASCDDPDLLASLNDIVDHHRAQIVTNSWGGLGEPDPVANAALLEAYQETFLQAALQGIGMFFSSGDAGDEVDNIGVRSVDFPASHPWVTAVGGTSLGVGQKNNYLFETGWGTSKSVLVNGAWTPAPPGNHLYGAGGGTSQLFSQPSYQRHVVPRSISNYFGRPAGRAVPDISAVGDPSTGMLVGETQTFPDGSVKYSEYRIGGTSLSSPLMAGVEALADQASGHAHGFANPAIYRLAGTSAVRDVVSPEKTKAVVRVDYVNAVDAADGLVYSLRTFNTTQSIFTRPGYDDVTGIGSPNGPAYVQRLGH